MILLEHIEKKYDDHGVKVEALKDINLRIEEGEMVAIMGPSASGKTTLLNILGLIDSATKGEYMLCGENVKQCSEKRLAQLRNEKIGFVVQDFALIERYSVLKNVMLPLSYSNRPSASWKSRAIEELERLGVPWKGNIYPTSLSGGQRQRVAIARALVNNADIILADEPTGSLDSITSEDVMNVFREINGRGKTIVIVTHDPKIGNACNKIIYISDGRILQTMEEAERQKSSNSKIKAF